MRGSWDERRSCNGRPSERRPSAGELPPHHAPDRVIERNVGAFGGWLSPPDWIPDFPHNRQWRAPGIMHCRAGNATRAIYYRWEHALSDFDGHVRVNLLPDRALLRVDADNHITHTG